MLSWKFEDRSHFASPDASQQQVMLEVRRKLLLQYISQGAREGQPIYTIDILQCENTCH